MHMAGHRETLRILLVALGDGTLDSTLTPGLQSLISD